MMRFPAGREAWPWKSIATTFLPARARCWKAPGAGLRNPFMHQSTRLANHDQPWESHPALQTLAAHNLGTLNALGCVARINHQVCLADNLRIIVRGMIGDNEHTVVLLQIVERRVAHFQIVFASASDIFKER